MEYKNLGTKKDNHKKSNGILNKLNGNGNDIHIEEKLGVESNGYEPRYVKILGVGSEIVRYFKKLIN